MQGITGKMGWTGSLRKSTAKVMGPLSSFHILLISPFLVFMLLSSATIVYVTAENMDSVRRLATESLDSVASALSLSASHAIESGDALPLKRMSAIFSDRIVAYALVADRSGLLLFHTNPRLVGSVIAPPVVKDLFAKVVPKGQRSTLQTGINTYQYTHPFQGPHSEELRLRIVLNTLPADRLIAKAQRIWWVMGAVLIAFWMIGLFFGWLLMHYVRLQGELTEKKHMALIGQMTAVLTHEIRNALGSIKGYTQWVDRKMQPDDALRQPVAMALGGIERVELLINELLLYSKDDQHRREKVNLTQLLRESLFAFQDWPGEIVAPEENEACVFVDKEKLQRVFINVVQNAIQAMGESGKITASVEPKGRLLRVRVADTGPGIRSEDLELVFTPFHTSKVNGTGIGLAYSRKVIEAMGGRIELANRVDGTGAVLTIYLPADKEGVVTNG